MNNTFRVEKNNFNGGFWTGLKNYVCDVCYKRYSNTNGGYEILGPPQLPRLSFVCSEQCAMFSIFRKM